MNNIQTTLQLIFIADSGGPLQVILPAHKCVSYM